MIGDKESDILAAKNSKNKIITIGVNTGYGKDDFGKSNPDYIASNLLDAVKRIILKEK